MVQAEEDGFDSFWLPQVSAGPGFDALTATSLAGSQTNRIALGTGVVPIFPIPPLTLAQVLATLDLEDWKRSCFHRRGSMPLGD